ncbi:MAG: phenylalanine--tRNA ligase subunit alpha [Candidatus Babeliales bacterium]
MDLYNHIELLKTTFLTEISHATTQASIEKIRLEFLSRKGKLSELLASLKNFSLEDKKKFGPILNTLKKELEEAFDAQCARVEKESIHAAQQKAQYFDVTAYKAAQLYGTLHPYTQVIRHIENIFISMGFQVADTPEVETEYRNFEALNIPDTHPAREMHDTFWLTIPGMLMRTHTSTAQSRIMELQKPPIAIVSPGRVYRYEAVDASHDFAFMQVESFLIDKNITISNLLALIKTLLQAIFEKDNLTIRVRPSYFPFVEPGIEVDMSCPFCTKGCSVCSQSRWIEMGGAGLIHPNVLRCGGIDPEEYSGCAFGFGLTRLVMLKYGISDIRLLSSMKVNFLKQF